MKQVPRRLNSLVLPCLLKCKNDSTKTCAFIDSGGNGYGFIDSNFARNLSLPLVKLPLPRVLRVVDGRESESGMVTHSAICQIQIGNHSEAARLFVTMLGHFPIILGHGWLRQHNPNIDWNLNKIKFTSSFCNANCLVPPIITGSPSSLENPNPAPDLDPTKNLNATENLDSKTKKSRKENLTTVKYATLTPVQESLQSGLARWTFGINSENINKYLVNNPLSNQKTSVINFASTASTHNPCNPGKTLADHGNRIPKWLQHNESVFSELDSRMLPLHREIDHRIVLKDGSTPPFGKLYGMTKEELVTLREWLQDNLSKGFIRPSSSPAASPVLFVKKSNGKLRLCMDYRALNAITVKNRYPIPLISETLDRLSKARYFTKVDVIAAFNRIRIAEGDEWKTAFRTRYGLFESLAMPFGLTNAPSTFQNYINNTLQEYLDVFCTAYLDDVLIYSNTRQEHRQHVNKVLEKLRHAGLQLDLEKCQFEATEVKYLGLMISRRGIEMDSTKIECIRNWNTPVNVKDIQAFLGFANFYRRFIKSFSTIARPLTELTKKNATWNWSLSCQKAFDKLKGEFVKSPILRHFDPDRRSLVEVDSSEWAHGGILSQYDDNGILHPVAYFSGKLSPAEINYEIYDKELLAVVRALEHWRPELEGTIEPVSIITDHKNLEYFMTTKTLNRRQARWSEFLSRFNFVITYRPGKQGGKPDSLTRRSGDLPLNQDDERVKYQQQLVLKSHNLDPKISPGFYNTLETPKETLKICPIQMEPADPGPTSTLR